MRKRDTTRPALRPVVSLSLCRAAPLRGSSSTRTISWRPKGNVLSMVKLATVSGGSGTGSPLGAARNARSPRPPGAARAALLSRSRRRACARGTRVRPEATRVARERHRRRRCRQIAGERTNAREQHEPARSHQQSARPSVDHCCHGSRSHRSCPSSQQRSSPLRWGLRARCCTD